MTLVLCEVAASQGNTIIKVDCVAVPHPDLSEKNSSRTLELQLTDSLNVNLGPKQS